MWYKMKREVNIDFTYGYEELSKGKYRGEYIESKIIFDCD